MDVNSRYATGFLFNAYRNKDKKYHATVFRRFPVSSAKFFLYEWKEEDRIDHVARKYLNDSALWWKIMDFNPEILNPETISGGTLIRIPNV